MPDPPPPRPQVDGAALRAFVAASTAVEDRVLLDDHTWDDLDMDAVAERLDRSVSLPGKMVLYRMLRTPTPSATVLSERERAIGEFERDRALCAAVSSELARLDRTVNAQELVGLLWGEPPPPLPSRWIYPLLAALAVASLAVAVAIGKILLLAPIVVVSLNGAIHFRTRLRWQGELAALRFVAALLAAGRRVASLEAEGLAAERQRLASAVRETAPLARQIAWLSSGGPRDLIYDYFNMFFLLEVQAFGRVLASLPRHLEALRSVFLTLGELDALRGVACWREEQVPWCRPELRGGPPHLVVEEGTHPLIEAAVPNSIHLSSRGALVTGANMSGKSTFLRVLGINAVLAQSIGTCTARRFEASRLRVLCSMRATDDVARGRSRYLAEAERLHTLVREAGAEPATLCLIDELLSGTGAAERLAASAAILEHLGRAGALVVAATHDLELAQQLQGTYDSYNFADDFTEDDVRFDHRIRAGLASRETPSGCSSGWATRPSSSRAHEAACDHAETPRPRRTRPARLDRRRPRGAAREPHPRAGAAPLPDRRDPARVAGPRHRCGATRVGSPARGRLPPRVERAVASGERGRHGQARAPPRRRRDRDRPDPGARAQHGLRLLAGRLHAAVRLLRHRAARHGPEPARGGDRSAVPRRRGRPGRRARRATWCSWAWASRSTTSTRSSPPSARSPTCCPGSHLVASRSRPRGCCRE